MNQSRVESIIEKSIILADDLVRQSDDVARLFGEERAAFDAHRAGEAALDDALNAAVLDADFRANSVKEGPLAGLARTSDVYKLAIKSVRAEALAGELKPQSDSVMRLLVSYHNAHLAYENAKTRLGGMRAASEILSSVLRALAAN